MKKSLLCMLMALAMCCMMFAACSGGASSSAAASEAAPASSAAAVSDAGEAWSTAPAAEGESLLVGCVVKFQHPHFTAMMNGAKDASAELGYECDAMAPGSVTDVMQQVQMVEDLVARNVDILLLCPNQPDTLVNVLNEADAKGITVVMIDTDMPEFEPRVAFVGSDAHESFVTAANELSSRLEEGSNVIILRGPLGDNTHETRTAGAVEGFEANGMNILEVFDAGSTAEGAAAAAEDFMLKYKEEGIDAILCTDGEMAVGTATAVKQAGKSGEILISGYDGNEATVEMVGAGDVTFDMAQNPYDMGYKGVMLGNDARDGKEVPEITDTGVLMITQDNYEDFLP